MYTGTESIRWYAPKFQRGERVGCGDSLGRLGRKVGDQLQTGCTRSVKIEVQTHCMHIMMEAQMDKNGRRSRFGTYLLRVAR
jgi:hypothetical protein